MGIKMLVDSPNAEPRGLTRRPGSNSKIALARAQVSRHLSRHLPYYLTPEEAHQIIDAAANERDRLFLQLLWQSGARVSEAIALRLGDVSKEGLRAFALLSNYLRSRDYLLKLAFRKVETTSN